MKNVIENFSIEFDLLITNATIYCMDIHNTVIPKGAVGIIEDKIVWVGQAVNQPQAAKKILDIDENLLTPGLIDCHTHVVYAGQRSKEFAMRLQGKSYQEIAMAGGGILSTVEAVKKASEHELFMAAKKRIDQMMAFGVTTLECKSGYGLDFENELKLLKVINTLAKKLSLRIYPTYLALHALPEDYKNQQDAYVDKVIEFLPLFLKEIEIKSVDAYCESFAFSNEQVKKLFQAAKKLGLDTRLHAEQFSNQQGAKLAASLASLSVDHLEYLNSCDCQDLMNTVAVLLPGAFYFLKEKKLPPIQALRHHCIPMAIATDCNPGTSPFLSLPLMMNMACVLFGLTIEEAWVGVTRAAAQALGMFDEIGSIESQKKADLVIWSTNSLEEIIYQPNYNFCHTVIYNGEIRHSH